MSRLPQDSLTQEFLSETEQATWLYLWAQYLSYMQIEV